MLFNRVGIEFEIFGNISKYFLNFWNILEIFWEYLGIFGNILEYFFLNVLEYFGKYLNILDDM